MEACLKHLQGFDKSLCNLADSNKDSHRRIDKRAKETEDLRKRVLELESQNILLGAKVRDSAMVSLISSLSSFLGRLFIQPSSPNVGGMEGVPIDSDSGEEGQGKGKGGRLLGY